MREPVVDVPVINTKGHNCCAQGPRHPPPSLRHRLPVHVLEEVHVLGAEGAARVGPRCPAGGAEPVAVRLDVPAEVVCAAV
eukprot:7180736-Alexandrium_andersonii.AAC.1